jgi:integrase
MLLELGIGEGLSSWRGTGISQLSLHGLRYTSATLALQAGIHPKVVQERLGHSWISTTMNIYTAVIEEIDSRAAETLAGLFGLVVTKKYRRRTLGDV